MTRLLFAAGVADDLARIAAHLREHEAPNVAGRLAEIVDALEVLALHPLIGRKVAGGRRELVIGKGARGYVALYAYDALDDVVAVAALRAQREAGYRDV